MYTLISCVVMVRMTGVFKMCSMCEPNDSVVVVRHLIHKVHESLADSASLIADLAMQKKWRRQCKDTAPVTAPPHIGGDMNGAGVDHVVDGAGTSDPRHCGGSDYGAGGIDHGDCNVVLFLAFMMHLNG